MMIVSCHMQQDVEITHTHTHTCDNEPWLRLGSVYDYVKISLKIWLVSPKDWEEGKKMVWSVFVAITCQWID